MTPVGASGGATPIATGGAGTGGAATGGAGTGGDATGGASAGGMTGSGGVRTGGMGGAATGGRGTGGAATGGAATGGAAVDPARYGFESGTQSWAGTAGSPAFTSITRDTSRRYAGESSLALGITASGAATYDLSVKPQPPIPAGTTITARVFIPAGAPFSWVQLYVQEGAPNYRWTGAGLAPSDGTWTRVTVTAPSSGDAIATLGIQLPLTQAWTGTVYVDSVTW